MSSIKQKYHKDAKVYNQITLIWCVLYSLIHLKIYTLTSQGAKPAAPKAPSSEPIKDHDQKQVQSITEVPLQGEGTSKKSSSSRSAIDTKVDFLALLHPLPC